MDVRQVRRMHKSKSRTIRGDEEDAAVSTRVQRARLRKTDFKVLFREAVKKSWPASRLPKLLMTSVPPGRNTRRMEAKASRVSRCDGEESPRKASRMTASYCLRQRFRK